jgi:hypothetical protein
MKIVSGYSGKRNRGMDSHDEESDSTKSALSHPLLVDFDHPGCLDGAAQCGAKGSFRTFTLFGVDAHHDCTRFS